MSNSPETIDSDEAREIAKKFLEQHHNVSDVHAILEGQTWKVMAKVGLPNLRMKTVLVDAQSGKILSWK